MNDLSVYYCPKCGRYAYVQRNSHISCSACSYDMKLLSVSCTEFMHLSLEKRNVLILDHILSEAKQNWMHQTIWKLLSRNKELEKRLEHSRSGSS